MPGSDGGADAPRADSEYFSDGTGSATVAPMLMNVLYAGDRQPDPYRRAERLLPSGNVAATMTNGTTGPQRRPMGSPSGSGWNRRHHFRPC
ncbi:MAG: hypothetical protein ACLR6J_08905 [Parabacteroides merdae]